MKSLNVKSITAKFMLGSMVLGVGFLFLVILAVFSFSNLEQQLETTLANNLGRIKENTRIGRELSQSIDQLNLVKNTFFTNDKELKSGRIKILQQLETTLKNSSDPQLNIQLEQFVTEVRHMLDQSEAVNLSFSHIENIGQTISEKLATLDEKSKRVKSELILKNEHSVAWEETAILMPGLASTQSLMHERLSGLGLNFFQQPLDDIGDHPILILAEDLIWRIRSMQRINSDISLSTKELLTALDTYTQHIRLLHYNAVEFKKKLAAMDLATTSMLSQIDKIDLRITEGIAAIYKDMADKMSTARRSLIFFSIILIIALGLFTFVFINSNIRKPMAQILQGIKLLSTGTLSTRIHLNRHDDWQLIEEALNQMTTELQRAYNDLDDHRSQLEVKVKTRTKELEDTNSFLKVANERLKELDKLKSMFIASISHELRTPLNSIIGFSSMMVDGSFGVLNEKYQDYSTRINNSGQHLLSLITDIIDISKIEAGRVDIVLGDFELADIVSEAVEELGQQIKGKGLSLEVNVPQNVAMHTDKRRFFQCLLNMLSNAMKYTEHGGIILTAEEQEDEVLMTIRDSGIGIREADLPRLFEAFERMKSHLQIKAGGTGLGLYLTRKIVTELLQGEVGVESKLGEGSRFWIRVPKTIDSQAITLPEEEV